MNALLVREPACTYAFPEKALKRWTQRWLTLETKEDSIVATFRYEGSTCSDGGVPLAFLFRVRLSGSPQGRRILEAACRPAEQDTGHQWMCSFKSDPMENESLWSDVRNLLGVELDEILKWQPEVVPAGCFCTRAHVNHKWRMVLQTLHYALKQQGASAS